MLVADKKSSKIYFPEKKQKLIIFNNKNIFLFHCFKPRGKTFKTERVLLKKLFRHFQIFRPNFGRGLARGVTMVPKTMKNNPKSRKCEFWNHEL